MKCSYLGIGWWRGHSKNDFSLAFFWRVCSVSPGFNESRWMDWKKATQSKQLGHRIAYCGTTGNPMLNPLKVECNQLFIIAVR